MQNQGISYIFLHSSRTDYTGKDELNLVIETSEKTDSNCAASDIWAERWYQDINIIGWV